ncbi:hypothetical protein [Amycolatopsis panacis]|uniref:hypothetical protein n=1 Tax=Amycolatopsis panacis TaxID=2340917 RepID=UPI001F27D965|nr:hypothetical protein [Amycolatopsis panacis]
MSENRWFDAWVPWPELSGLAAAASRALLPSVPATPAAAVRMVTEQLVGRRLTTTVEGHKVGLTLTELDYPADSLRLATGRVGDVRIVAEDVDWPKHSSPAAPSAEHKHDPAGRPSISGTPGGTSGPERETTTPLSIRPESAAGETRAASDRARTDKQPSPKTTDRPAAEQLGPTASTEPAVDPAVERVPLRRVTLWARDVRLRGLPSPAVVPTSVELHIAVSGEVVREQVARTRPDVIATPHAEGFRLRWRKHPQWGHLTLVAGVEESRVVLTPTTLHIGRWTTRLARRIRPIVLPLPDLPKGLRLTGVHPGENELVLTTTADEWPGRLARIPLPDILNWLTTAAMTLTLPGFARFLP